MKSTGHKVRKRTRVQCLLRIAACKGIEDLMGPHAQSVLAWLHKACDLASKLMSVGPPYGPLEGEGLEAVLLGPPPEPMQLMAPPDNRLYNYLVFGERATSVQEVVEHYLRYSGLSDVERCKRLRRSVLAAEDVHDPLPEGDGYCPATDFQAFVWETAPLYRDDAIRKMALAIYRDRTFNDMPMLGDLLEEAGCPVRAVLDHCRRPVIHVEGCWVLDYILDWR
jgi:hypothetical protein